ncbi:MAG: glycosyltransferase [Leptolyngbyaceae cyanobacterium]
MSDKESPFVSVIIPVYNQAEPLQRCLAALEQQTYPRSQFEIIVVDNVSDDFEAIAAATSSYSNVKLTQEIMPGSYAARNQGITLASGEVLAFTDADCVPATNWLGEGVYQLTQQPNCGQVVGAVEVFFVNPSQPTPIELFERVTAFPQAQLLAQLHGGATANIFTWRTVIDTVGLFDPQLKSNGDLEWGQRVHAKGYQQIYADSVRVRHPARTSWPELAMRTRRLVGGQYERQLKTASSPWQRHQVFVQNFLFHLMPPVFFAMSTLRDRRLKGLNQKLTVVRVMIFVRAVGAWEMLRLKSGAAARRT